MTPEVLREFYVIAAKKRVGSSLLLPTQHAEKGRVYTKDLNEMIRGETTPRNPMNIKNLAEVEYLLLRHMGANYPQSDTSDLETVCSRPSSNIAVVHNDGWYLRRPPNAERAAKMYQHRISLNVRFSTQLIESLDAFIEKHDGVVYKTSDNPESWRSRHDPVTLYFINQPSATVCDEVIAITKPFLREEKSTRCLGDRLYDGIYLASEPTSQQIDAVNKCYRDYLRFRRNVIDDSSRKSIGQFHAMQDLMIELEDLLMRKGMIQRRIISKHPPQNQSPRLRKYSPFTVRGRWWGKEPR